MSGPAGGGTDGAAVTAKAACLACLQPKTRPVPQEMAEAGRDFIDGYDHVTLPHFAGANNVAADMRWGPFWTPRRRAACRGNGGPKAGSGGRARHLASEESATVAGLRPAVVSRPAAPTNPV